MKWAALPVFFEACLGSAEFTEVDIKSLGIDELAGSSSFVDSNSDGHIDFWAGYAYLNDGTGHFTKLVSSYWGGGEIVCWGDYNNDGYPDALTSKTVWIDTTPAKDTCFIILYENSGPPEYKLVDVSPEKGLGFPILDRDLNDPAWLDFDSDGLLDFYYSSYEFVPLGTEADTLYWSGHEDYLFHNTGSGFEDVSDAAGIREGGADTLCSRGVSVADFDNDGDMDVFVSVYRLQPNLLWQNNGNGTLTNVAEEKGVIGILDQGYYGHNIGAAWGDYNNDGNLDLFTPITHHPTYPGDPTCHLWASDGPPSWTFTDHFAESGMNNTEIGSAPAWGDYDNDGDLDLYWVNLYGAPSKQGWLYRNDGNNQFPDASLETGAKIWGSVSYVIWLDYNEDGKLDLYAPYSRGTDSYLVFFTNTAERGHWLELDFEGRESNHFGIGSRVWAYCGDLMVMREVAPSDGNGYGSMFVARQHLGLGDHDMIDSLVIRWPQGRIDRILSLEADRLIGMVEGPPSAPERLVYSQGGDTYYLKWTTPGERDVRGYRLWLRTNSSAPWSLVRDGIPRDSNFCTYMSEPPAGEFSVTAYDYCVEDNESPHSPVAVAVTENPSSHLDLEVESLSSKMISCMFSLESGSDVSLSVYDACGRKIKTLAAGYYPSGAHDLCWTGNDDYGLMSPSGVYFVRLTLDGKASEIRKVVLR